jgi:hypothetical protein
MDAKEKKDDDYLEMITAIKLTPCKGKHKKNVLKIMLRLYSHGYPYEQTEAAKIAAIGEILQIHHENEIAELADELMKDMSPKEAMALSLDKTQMTKPEHDIETKSKKSNKVKNAKK